MNTKIYEHIDGGFYEDQLRSRNPLRRWYHSSRYLLVNSLAKSFYQPGMKVVDVGAGSCSWNVDCLDVVGVDCNRELLRRGQEQERLKEILVSDIAQMALPDDSADIVIATEVLEHIVDVDAVVREVRRIMKPQGVFIASVPDDRGLSLWRILFFFQTIYRGYIKGEEYYRHQCGHVQHFSISTLETLFRAHGFIIDILFSYKTFSLFLVAWKTEEVFSQTCEDLTVILPVKNEAQNIRTVIEGLREKYPDVQIIVADDGSTDGTPEIINAMKASGKLAFIDRRNEIVKGLTASVLDAIAHVTTPYFVVMDADCQHDVKYVRRIYNQLKLGCKFCVASRAVVLNWAFNRKLISIIGSILGKGVLLMQKKRVPKDILSGFFGADIECWREVVRGQEDRFSMPGYKVLFDFLLLHDGKVNIENTYYEFNNRPTGRSKMGYKIYVEFFKSILRGLRKG